MAEELIKLAELVEAAEGLPDELNAHVRRIVYAPPSAYVERSKFNGAWVIYDGVHQSGRSRLFEGPGHGQNYIGSIDAAMALVPEECYWQVGHDGEGRDPSMFAARVFDPLTMKRPCTAIAETPALALCAASLRARASTSSKGES